MTKPLALIVEDDDDARTIFKKTLQLAGFEVETVGDGGSALKRLSKIVPTLVILDIHLPLASGKDVLHQIRTDERLAQTRVMLTTADALLAATIQHEADSVLLKPIDFAQLRDLAKRLHPAFEE